MNWNQDYLLKKLKCNVSSKTISIAPKKKLSKKARLALEGMTITPEEGSTNTLNVTVGKDEDEF